MKSVLIYYFAIGAVVNFLWILLTMWADKDLLTKEDLRNPLGFIFAFISIYIDYGIIIIPFWTLVILAYISSYGANIKKI